MVPTEPGSETTDNPSCVVCGRPFPAKKTGRPRRYCDRVCARAARTVSASLQTSEGTPHTPDTDRAEGRRECVRASEKHASSDVLDPPADTSGEFRTWYYANFASTPGQDPISTRRKLRYRLRHLLREVTTVNRCKGCGWEPIANGISIKLGSKDGRRTSGFGGLETCGRIWLCPVCSAKIRVRRGDQIAEGVARHMENGGSAWFLTITLPHEKGDALKDSFDALTQAWRYVKTGRAYQTEKKWFGILGEIKAVEVTHGENGWHPHAHILILTNRHIETDEFFAWAARLDARWAKGLAKVGWPTGKPGVRLKLVPVEKGKGIAAYVAKVQEKGLGNEIARADMKDATQGNRTPFGILADFGNHARADDVELWWEYEQATAGRSAIRWSPGLWAKLMPDVDEQSDDDIAAEDEGSAAVAYLAPWTWRRIRAIPGADTAILEAVENDGWEGLLRCLIRYRIGAQGVYTPEEWSTPNEVELEPL